MTEELTLGKNPPEKPNLQKLPTQPQYETRAGQPEPPEPSSEPSRMMTLHELEARVGMNANSILSVIGPERIMKHKLNMISNNLKERERRLTESSRHLRVKENDLFLKEISQRVENKRLIVEEKDLDKKLKTANQFELEIVSSVLSKVHGALVVDAQTENADIINKHVSEKINTLAAAYGIGK